MNPGFTEGLAGYTGTVCGGKTLAPYVKLSGKKNVLGPMTSLVRYSNQTSDL